MTNHPYRPPCTVKLSASGDQTTANQGSLAPDQTPADLLNSLEGAANSKTYPPEKIRPGLKTDSRQACIRILSDPDATEDEWLIACQALEVFDQGSGAPATVGTRRRKFNWSLPSLILLGATVGGAAYFHMGPFAPPAEVPQPVAQVPVAATAQDVDFGPYMADLQRRIKRHWYPPVGASSEKIIVHFKVARDGAISNLGIDKSSGRGDSDQAAIKAVIDTMPSARPLPLGAPETVDIQFTFQSNVNLR